MIFANEITNGDIPIMWIPYPNTCVEASSRDLLSIKSDGIDLAEMALQSP